MTIFEALRETRRLVAGGWLGPEDFLQRCGYRDGADPNSGTPIVRPCAYRDERVELYSVDGAIRAVASRQANQHELILGCWSALERIISPVAWRLEHFYAVDLRGRGLPAYSETTKPVWQRALALTLATLSPEESALDWLRRQERTLSDVLRAFDKAIARAKGERP